jgi:type IV secretory pathway TraG/TraD family ATPase VirD4
LPVAISVLRKHSVSILQIYQHPAQLKMYGELAKSIHANSGIKIYLGGGIPQDTAEELSKALGQFEYNDDGVRRIMPLMTPDSVRQMDESIVFIGSKPPIKTKLTPYFKNRKLLKLTQLPEYTPECKIPYTTAPQINLD